MDHKSVFQKFAELYQSAPSVNFKVSYDKTLEFKTELYQEKQKMLDELTESYGQNEIPQNELDFVDEFIWTSKYPMRFPPYPDVVNMDPNIRCGYLYGRNFRDDDDIMMLYRESGDWIWKPGFKELYIDFLQFWFQMKSMSLIFKYSNYCSQDAHYEDVKALYEVYNQIVDDHQD